MEDAAFNEDAFERFYDATAPAIRAYILRHCSDRGAADDLFQAAYIKFLGSRMARTPAAPEARAYLYRIASNVITDHGRGLQRRERFEAASDREAVATNPPAAGLENLELRKALRELPERDQQLLWLLYAEGFSHKEVAGIMNVSHGSVRVLAFRARKKLQGILEASQSDSTGGEA